MTKRLNDILAVILAFVCFAMLLPVYAAYEENDDTDSKIEEFTEEDNCIERSENYGISEMQLDNERENDDTIDADNDEENDDEEEERSGEYNISVSYVGWSVNYPAYGFFSGTITLTSQNGYGTIVIPVAEQSSGNFYISFGDYSFAYFSGTVSNYHSSYGLNFNFNNKIDIPIDFIAPI